MASEHRSGHWLCEVESGPLLGGTSYFGKPGQDLISPHLHGGGAGLEHCSKLPKHRQQSQREDEMDEEKAMVGHGVMSHD
ncbi:MAG: hypothetical protein RBU30_13050, partial [Polyangia bacterium]|nr:hypothetical protein [Polyangia bacterium]